ncbi:hypothetical protein CEXT_392821 [Caerostris extrusa]|uniref:Uncharacterized protein n=1 Tax=Caerostris extrusa TaxID=172846 RepID=A0AAV4MT41_CAEEX|nr:hypothetical protein CEXT_392821 [Caerostris extrusa]
MVDLFKGPRYDVFSGRDGEISWEAGVILNIALAAKCTISGGFRIFVGVRHNPSQNECGKVCQTFQDVFIHPFGF